jgi:hypothetical protein
MHQLKKGIRMIIKILTQEIESNIRTDDEILDRNIMDILVDIRKLRAAIVLRGIDVEVRNTNAHGQVFIDQFEVWINSNEYSVV